MILRECAVHLMCLISMCWMFLLAVPRASYEISGNGNVHDMDPNVDGEPEHLGPNPHKVILDN